MGGGKSGRECSAGAPAPAGPRNLKGQTRKSGGAVLIMNAVTFGLSLLRGPNLGICRDMLFADPFLLRVVFTQCGALFPLCGY